MSAGKGAAGKEDMKVSTWQSKGAAPGSILRKF